MGAARSSQPALETQNEGFVRPAAGDAAGGPRWEAFSARGIVRAGVYRRGIGASGRAAPKQPGRGKGPFRALDRLPRKVFHRHMY